MKTILLTGATDGIGLETAKMFAKAGCKLLLHGRNKSKLSKVKEQLLYEHKQAMVQIWQADFSVLQDVRNMAQGILETEQPLDAIVNNAGVFVVEEQYARTADGLDIRFTVNTIAPYIVTKMLLPLLSAQSRVVNVTSAAQSPVSLDAVQGYTGLSHDTAYAQSKLALILWTRVLAQAHAKGPSFMAVNPKSFLGSKMVHEAYGQEGHDVKIGAKILYAAAVAEEFSHANGLYYDNDYGSFSQPHPFALQEEPAQALVHLLDNFVRI